MSCDGDRIDRTAANGGWYAVRTRRTAMFKSVAIVVLALLGTSVLAPAQRLELRFGSSRFGAVDTSCPPAAPVCGEVAAPSVRWRVANESDCDTGHYRTVTRRVWVEGHRRTVWIPAEFAWSYDSCGRRVRVCVRPGRYETVCEPGRYEYRTERVWVPARRW